MKTFREAIRSKEFSLLGQLRLHQDDSRDDVLAQARKLAPAVDAVSVTDCPYGVLHMSGLAVAALLLGEDIDPVLHLSSRDRNRIALKSELLGAAALGVTSFILKRGDPLPADAEPAIKQVFDSGAKRLIATARQLSDFEKANGRNQLNLGALATAFDPEPAWRPVELVAKAEAGASFFQTQICLDLELLERYLQALVAARLTWRSSIIVSVPVLSSAADARWLFENLRGSVMPEQVVHSFERAADERAFGIEYCARTIRALKEIPGVRGANLSTSGDPEAIVAAIEASAV